MNKWYYTALYGTSQSTRLKNSNKMKQNADI